MLSVLRCRKADPPGILEKSPEVLGCRYVDDVLLDAPWQVTREMIATLRCLDDVNGPRGRMLLDTSLIFTNIHEVFHPYPAFVLLTSDLGTVS